MKFIMFLLVKIYHKFLNYIKINVIIDDNISIRYICVKVVDYYDTRTRMNVIRTNLFSSFFNNQIKVIPVQWNKFMKNVYNSIM